MLTTDSSSLEGGERPWAGTAASSSPDGRDGGAVAVAGDSVGGGLSVVGVGPGLVVAATGGVVAGGVVVAGVVADGVVVGGAVVVGADVDVDVRALVGWSPALLTGDAAPSTAPLPQAEANS
jgi:hypothetical protein